MIGRNLWALMPALLLALALPAGCQRETDIQALQVTGRIFVFNYRLAYATYMITLAKTAPLPDGTTVRASFENPAGGPSLTLERRVFPLQDRIVLESPDVTCVKKDRPYAVTITLNDAAGTPLQTLTTTVTSSLDQSILPARPLVVGPAYEKNPDMFANGQAPGRFAGMTCPAENGGRDD